MAPKTLRYARIAITAQDLGVARSTLLSAFGRGEIRGVYTACGQPLIDPVSAADWLSRADERSPGRKANVWIPGVKKH